MAKISLQLTNDLAVPVSLNVLGGAADGSNQNNADTLYEWDLSAENWVNVDTVIIQSRLRGQTIYQSYSTTITNLSYEGVALTLSTLNLGNFKNDRAIIYTYNSELEFGDLILTLTNIPQPSGYTALLYEHFVPAGTILREQVYPTIEAFESDYGPAITLLFQQTNAASAIDTYGAGCVYPIQGVDPIGFITFPPRITLSTPTPKASDMQPILSGSFGTVQGYEFDWPTLPDTANNMLLYFPSGDALEVVSLFVQGMNSWIFNFAQGYWNLANYLSSVSKKRMTSQGMFTDMAQLSQFEFNALTQTYPSGWTAPAVFMDNPYTFSLDAPGIQPAQIFENPYDFSVGLFGNTFRVEGYRNIRINPTGLFTNNFYFGAQIQYNEDVILGSAFNRLFEFFDGQYQVNFFDMGFSNNNCSFEDLTTPIRWNGWSTVKMDGINLTAFPPIDRMNRWENTAPYNQWQLNLNLSSNNLPVVQVNQILIDLANNAIAGKISFTTSVINLSAQTPLAPPSGAGITAVNTLISFGITVITD